ncbi:hypothetical protein AVEN_236159-1, partial [Araneus ventricosus]
LLLFKSSNPHLQSAQSCCPFPANANGGNLNGYQIFFGPDAKNAAAGMLVYFVQLRIIAPAAAFLAQA